MDVSIRIATLTSKLLIEAHIDMMSLFIDWPCGLMDKASVSGAEDCRFESCHGRHFLVHSET